MTRWLARLPRPVALGFITFALFLALLAIYALVGYGPNYEALERRNLSAIQDLALTLSLDQRTDIFDALQRFADPVYVDKNLCPANPANAPLQEGNASSVQRRTDCHPGWLLGLMGGANDGPQGEKTKTAKVGKLPNCSAGPKLLSYLDAPGADLVYVGVCEVDSDSGAPPNAVYGLKELRLDLDETMARSRAATFFPTVLLLSGDGRRVVASAPSRNPPVPELDAASVAALVPPPSSEDKDDQVEGIVIAGEPHLLFARRMRLLPDPHLPETVASLPGDTQLGNELILVGLVAQAKFRMEALRLPYHAALFLCLLTLSAFVSLPFVHLRLMGPRDELTAPLVLQVLLAGSLGLILAALTAGDIIFYNGLKNMVDRQLEDLAERLHENFALERRKLDDLLADLEAPEDPPWFGKLRAGSTGCAVEAGVHCNILNSADPSLCEVKGILQHAPVGTPSERQSVERIVWIDGKGKQLLRLGVGTTGASLQDVRDRPYVTETLALAAKSGERRTALYSIVDRLQAEAVSIAVRQPPFRRDAFPVVVLRPVSLTEVVLPPGFSFVIFDHGGTAQYHSSPDRNLRENVFDATDREPWLIAASAARIRRNGSLDYLGRPSQAHVTPVPGTSWTILMLWDKHESRSMNLHAVSRAALLASIYWFLAAVVPSCIWAWALLRRSRSHALRIGEPPPKGRLLTLAWPEPRLVPHYRCLTLSMICVGALWYWVMAQPDWRVVAVYTTLVGIATLLLITVATLPPELATRRSQAVRHWLKSVAEAIRPVSRRSGRSLGASAPATAAPHAPNPNPPNFPDPGAPVSRPAGGALPPTSSSTRVLLRARALLAKVLEGLARSLGESRLPLVWGVAGVAVGLSFPLVLGWMRPALLTPSAVVGGLAMLPWLHLAVTGNGRSSIRRSAARNYFGHYLFLMAILGVVAVVLPTLAAFKIAYDHELMLMVRHGQRAVAESLARRQASIVGRYRHLLCGDRPACPELQELAPLITSRVNKERSDVVLDGWFDTRLHRVAEAGRPGANQPLDGATRSAFAGRRNVLPPWQTLLRVILNESEASRADLWRPAANGSWTFRDETPEGYAVRGEARVKSRSAHTRWSPIGPVEGPIRWAYDDAEIPVWMPSPSGVRNYALTLSSRVPLVAVGWPPLGNLLATSLIVALIGGWLAWRMMRWVMGRIFIGRLPLVREPSGASAGGKWEDLGEREKLALIHLVRHGFVNSHLRDAVARLVRQGWLTVSPRLEFRRPLDRSRAWRESQALVIRAQQASARGGGAASGRPSGTPPASQEKSGTVRAAIVVVALAFFSFLMVVQPALVTTSVTWLGGLFAAVGALLKGLDSLRKQA